MTTAVERLSAHALAQHVEARHVSWLQQDPYQPLPHSTMYASGWRRCERRAVLDLTQPDQALPFPAEVRARMMRGNDREDNIVADYQKMGRDAEPPFEIIAQQERFELRGRSGSVVITGKVDGRIKVERHRISAPIEIKTWSPNIVERIETFDDVFDNQWTRAGGYQLLAYCYGANEEYGFLVLDRPGLPKLLPVELTSTNLDRMEAFLSTAERVVAHRLAGTLPDYIDDAVECKRCPYYGTACNPPLVPKTDAQILTDPELEAALERWHELAAAGREFDALDRDIKRRLRGVELGQVGRFGIAGSWSRSTRLDLPADLKRQYSISDPRGRFTLDIRRF